MASFYIEEQSFERMRFWAVRPRIVAGEFVVYNFIVHELSPVESRKLAFDCFLKQVDETTIDAVYWNLWGIRKKVVPYENWVNVTGLNFMVNPPWRPFEDLYVTDIVRKLLFRNSDDVVFRARSLDTQFLNGEIKNHVALNQEKATLGLRSVLPDDLCKVIGGQVELPEWLKYMQDHLATYETEPRGYFFEHPYCNMYEWKLDQIIMRIKMQGVRGDCTVGVGLTGCHMAIQERLAKRDVIDCRSFGLQHMDEAHDDDTDANDYMGCFYDIEEKLMSDLGRSKRKVSAKRRPPQKGYKELLVSQ